MSLIRPKRPLHRAEAAEAPSDTFRARRCKSVAGLVCPLAWLAPPAEVVLAERDSREESNERTKDDMERTSEARGAKLYAPCHLFPTFRPFKNEDFTSPTGGSAVASSLLPRADALGGAIPELSFPAGQNPVPRFSATRNRDLMALQDGWPQERLSNSNAQNRWFHSDIKNIAYPQPDPFLNARRALLARSMSARSGPPTTTITRPTSGTAVSSVPLCRNKKTTGKLCWAARASILPRG